MKIAATANLLLLPFTPRVRRAALVAGIASAVLTGGLPFVGYGPAFAMGRVVPLVSPLAFILHLLLAIVYGGILSLAIGRSRGWWTFVAALATTLLLDCANLWLMRAWEFPLIAVGGRSLAAHLLFGFVFTLSFKFHEASELSAHHVEAR